VAARAIRDKGLLARSRIFITRFLFGIEGEACDDMPKESKKESSGGTYVRRNKVGGVEVDILVIVVGHIVVADVSLQCTAQQS
jgi:hypothetical protein